MLDAAVEHCRHLMDQHVARDRAVAHTLHRYGVQRVDLLAALARPSSYTEEVFEACPCCDTEGCTWCDDTGVVPHDCDA